MLESRTHRQERPYNIHRRTTSPAIEQSPERSEFLIDTLQQVIDGKIQDSAIPANLRHVTQFSVSINNAVDERVIPCLDQNAVRFILEHQDQLRATQLWPLVHIAQELEHPNIRRNLEHIALQNVERTCIPTDLWIAPIINPTSWQDPVLGAEFFIALRTVPAAFTMLRDDLEEKNQTITPADLDASWPPDLLAVAQTRLTLAERVELQHALVMGMKNAWHERQQSLNITTFSRRVSEFVSDYYTSFTPEVLAKFTGLDPHDCSPEYIENIFISSHPSTTLEPFLEHLGYEGPVVALPEYRNYISCPQTEARLLDELVNHKATILHLKFPDGSAVVFAVKYTEITIGVCISSTHPNFHEQESYIPVGNTLRWAQQHDYGDRIEHRFTKQDGEQRIQQIWAHNRRVDFSDAEWTNIRMMVASYGPAYDQYEHLPKYAGHGRRQA